MKKFLFYTTLWLCILLGSGYLIGNFALKKVSEKALVAAPEFARRLGLELKNPAYESANLLPPLAASWQGVSGRVKFAKANRLAKQGAEFFLVAPDVRLSLPSFSLKRVLLEVEGAMIEPSSNPLHPTTAENVKLREEFVPGRLIADELQVLIEIKEITNPLGLAREIISELNSLLRSGVTQLPIVFSGKVHFELGNSPRSVGVMTDSRDGGWGASVKQE